MNTIPDDEDLITHDIIQAYKRSIPVSTKSNSLEFNACKYAFLVLLVFVVLIGLCWKLFQRDIESLYTDEQVEETQHIEENMDAAENAVKKEVDTLKKRKKKFKLETQYVDLPTFPFEKQH